MMHLSNGHIWGKIDADTHMMALMQRRPDAYTGGGEMHADGRTLHS